MSSIWGNKFKVSLFGESHGPAVGVTIEGVKPGLKLERDYISTEMMRRAPGRNSLSTQRKEADEYEILSGILDDTATGAPICAVVRNTNTRSNDYSELKIKPRPSHADYTGYVKYKGFNDIRGGGHFSARITAGLVFAGSIAKLQLMEKGINIGAHIESLHNIKDRTFESCDLYNEKFIELSKMDIPLLNAGLEEEMKKKINDARMDMDSVGGVIELAVTGIQAGIGDPFFDSFESIMSHMIFSIPGVKGISFGSGFAISEMTGSEANDEFTVRDGKIITKTNNNGGINGGISNGMPVIMHIAMKPTPSIAKEQNTVNLESLTDTKLSIKGRHDPCIAIRAVPVLESAAAIAVLDMIYSCGGMI